MTTYRETLELTRLSLIEAAAKVAIAIREGKMGPQEELFLTQSLHGCKSIIKQAIDAQPENLDDSYTDC